MAIRGRSETSRPSRLTVTSRGSMPAPGREPAGPVTSALRRGPVAMVNIPGEYSLAHRRHAQPRGNPPPKPSPISGPGFALLHRARMDLNRLTLHAFPYLQSPLRRYVISVPSCHSIRCFLLSCPRLALDSVPPPILAPSCASGKAVCPASARRWLFPGVDPSSAFPVPRALPPSRPGLLVSTVLTKLCVCARHCRLRLYLPLQPRDQEAWPCSYHLLGKPCGSLGFNRLDHPQCQGQAPILGRNIALASGGIAGHKPASAALPPVS